MTSDQFKQSVRECRTEFEVKKIVHWYWSSVTGTAEEVVAALAFADDRAAELAVVEEGALGGRALELSVL